MRIEVVVLLGVIFGFLGYLLPGIPDRFYRQGKIVWISSSLPDMKRNLGRIFVGVGITLEAIALTMLITS